MHDSIVSEAHRPFDLARLELARLGPDQSLEICFRRICEIASETLNVNRVGIWFFIAHRTALRCANLYERDSGEHSTGVTLQVEDFPAYFAALERRRSIPAEVATEDPRTNQLSDRYLQPLGISSLLDAPIYRDGKVIGVVCHEHTGTLREWSTEERDFVSSIADFVTLKLKSADLSEARTVLRQTDDVLFSLERAESMTRIVTEAAHDFKNILTVVIGFANELTHANDMPGHLREMAAHILKAGERGSELVRQMTAYGHTESNELEAISVGDAVRRMLPLLRTATGSSCRLNVEIESDSGRVFLDPSQLERVVCNLVMNARDAMPAGGAVQLRVSTEELGEAHHAASKFATLTVSDSGAGMDQATQAKIFEPFFTTKPRGQGTGLGLAIVQRIVERAGGFIRIESEPERGTKVRVYFPFVSRL
ncbi:MAG: GAF domain-containing protein [Gemmataceae bacterium]|nr:GAF domain-containing protein [Gemmataceae bacterium]